MSPNEIYTYSLNGPNSEKVIKHGLTSLNPYLPVSIQLYRRLQFGRFFHATSLLTNVSIRSTPVPDSPWVFAFVDRSCRPETEVWIFGSWEIEGSVPTDETQPTIDELVTNLLRKMKDLGVPTSIHQEILDADAGKALDDAKDKVGFSRNDYGGHAADPNIMLFGAVHEQTVRIIERLGFITRKFKSGMVPNHTFIWNVDGLAQIKQLPLGLRWGELKTEHFHIVRSRTAIPRQDRTLAVLPNVGIFTKDSEQPISWAFVGLDASLTTLHVEEEWRGKGLAKATTTKLFQEKMDMFWEEGLPKLAHGYVIVGNEESSGMCRSLGGKSNWECYWLRVDLSKV